MFRCNNDREMVNTGTKNKPFLSAKVETWEYLCGPIRYCTIRVEKTMEDIGDESKQWFVKTYQYVRVRVFGITFRDSEQNSKYDKL